MIHKRPCDRGCPANVTAETKANLQIFAPGGGYVFAPVHNIQADVPAANIRAMVESAVTLGVGPEQPA